jgi:hypothetical protein
MIPRHPSMSERQIDKFRVYLLHHMRSYLNCGALDLTELRKQWQNRRAQPENIRGKTCAYRKVPKFNKFVVKNGENY